MRILRDTWGVPHVFGRTDADVAYGLAWAHAEDDFATIQAILLASRGRLASVYGRDAAANDYMVQLLRVREAVDARYESDLSPETRAVCEAYAAGVNHYAALHPRDVLAALYPARGKDVAAGFVHKLPLFFGLDRVLRRLFAEQRSPAADDAPPLGSNAIAVAPARSSDGATRLAINSHQPWEGPVAWYEAHLVSEQGWDMVGGVFPGAPIVLHGHNRDLGWAHTVNRPDLIDVYRLQLDPNDPDRYRFDGGWRAFERRKAPIEVKLLGPLRWTFQREVLWSAYGPALRRPHGTYALRVAGLGDVRAVEQWYRMNKARSLEEWRGAMRMQAIPSLNSVYADRSGHIAYLYNARLPLRAEGYDWSGELPGDSSASLWTDYLPFERLPWVLDPPAGFLQSCNSTPFETTLPPHNPLREDYPPALGIETNMTNRALRARELFGADDSITREEFTEYKFDVTYSTLSSAALLRERILALPAPADPMLDRAREILRAWDLRADPENRGTALAVLTLRPDDQNTPRALSAEALWARLAEAASRLRRRFGRLDPRWADVNRLRRGTLDLGLGGAPDVLHAVYGRLDPDGRVRGLGGDSYVLLVEWDRAGRVSSRSIHQYGSATLDARSPHYADQAPLFARGELKPVWLDEADIRAHLEREYRPGERARPSVTLSSGP